MARLAGTSRTQKHRHLAGIAGARRGCYALPAERSDAWSGANATHTRTTTFENQCLQVHVLSFLGGNVGVAAREHVYAPKHKCYRRITHTLARSTYPGKSLAYDSQHSLQDNLVLHLVSGHRDGYYHSCLPRPLRACWGSTPSSLGRLSFSPIAVDPFGFLLLILVGFGWGRPVPFNPYNLKNQRWGRHCGVCRSAFNVPGTPGHYRVFF